MKIRKITALTSLLIILIGQQIYAQQYPLRYMYDQYKYVVNPAAIKIGKGVGLHANYSQNRFDEIVNNNHLGGFGIEGGFLYENMGLGLVFSQENTGILKNTDVKLSYAYRVRLTENHWLTFGLSAGIFYQGQNTTDIITGDYSDLLIGKSQTDFCGGFGLNYTWKKLEIDVSIPNYNMLNKKNVPLFASASYNFSLVEDWGLKPIIMYNGLNPQMNLVDIRLQASYKEYACLQVGYRTSKELLFVAGGSYKNVSLGVAYGFNLSNYGDLNKGNFELILGYRFVNAKLKKQTSQREINRKTQQSLTKIDESLSTLKESDAKQAQELEKINQSVQSLNNELLNDFKGSLNEIKENVLSIQREEVEINEAKIVDKGYFVVVYSTTTREDAEAIVYRMSKQGVQGYIIKDSKRAFYYIYTATFDNIHSALDYSEKERQRGFSGAWVLVIK